MSQIKVCNLIKTYSIGNKSNNIKEYVKNFISKETKTVRAVNDISFEIEKGEVIGFLGPNGAGKSSTIKMMTGILTPDSGEVEINGFCPWKERKKYVKQIGVVFGQRSNLWWDLPARDSFELFKSIYKISDVDYKANMKLFTEILELDDMIDKPVRQMSLGQRMQCEIVGSFLHNPEIVFLDEPTIGLDVVVKEKIINIIRTLNKEKGVTIVLTTHDISDVEELCNRVIIIDKGQKVFDNSIEAIRQINGNIKYLKVEYKYNTLIDIPEFNSTDDLNQIKTIEYYPGEMSLSSLINKLESFGEIVDIEITGVPIEKVIKDIYNNKIIF